MSDAVVEFMDAHDDAESIVPEELPDGWIFTASNTQEDADDADKDDAPAESYWVLARRVVGGTAYSVHATLRTPEQQRAAAMFAKSIVEG